MVQLRQFNLQFPVRTLSALRENIQNQTRPVNDPTLQGLLKVSLLSRTQGMVENDHISLVQYKRIRDLLHLAFARIGRTVRKFSLSLDRGANRSASRLGEQAYLLTPIGYRAFAKIKLNNNRTFPTRVTLKHRRASIPK
jgi:hypothetical protein